MPQISKPHDVVIAINYTGICGSDVHYWEHGAIGHHVVRDSMVLGHESSGTVVEVGSAVGTPTTGDRVALEPGYPCRLSGWSIQSLPRHGLTVVVMGAGPVGLLCAAVSRVFGATKVISTDLVQWKLDFAKAFASTHSYLFQRISAEAKVKTLAAECHLDKGADVVIDASGAESSIQASLQIFKT